MGEECSICGRDDVPLNEGVIDSEIKKICEKCCETHDYIVLISKPTISQLQEAERPFSVYERLRRMSRMRIHNDEFELRQAERRKEAQINLAKLAAVRNDAEFMKKQEERKKLNLAPDFNEQIKNARNLKGLSQKQLADAIAEPEDAVRLLERGVTSENSDNSLKKIEQYFRIDLRKKVQEKKPLDFKSGTMTIGDLKDLRKEMFGKS